MKSYFEADANNASALKQAAKSMAHYYQYRYLGVDMPPTPAMQFGTLCHALILEPDTHNFAGMPDFGDLRKKDNKELKAQWEAANAGKIGIKMDDWTRANNIRDVVMGSRASDLLHGEFETPCFWREMDMDQKALFDCVNTSVIDLKTTMDASPEGFAKQSFNLGYHIQVAQYRAGFEMTRFSVPDFYFIAVETQPPHNVAIYRASEDLCERGAEIRLSLLDRIKTCMDKDEWPGYGSNTHILDLPRWAKA